MSRKIFHSTPRRSRSRMRLAETFVTSISSTFPRAAQWAGLDAEGSGEQHAKVAAVELHARTLRHASERELVTDRAVGRVEGESVARRTSEPVGVIVAAAGPRRGHVRRERARQRRATVDERDRPLTVKRRQEHPPGSRTATAAPRTGESKVRSNAEPPLASCTYTSVRPDEVRVRARPARPVIGSISATAAGRPAIGSHALTESDATIEVLPTLPRYGA